VETAAPGDTLAVPVDPDQIQQVLLNLVKNAVEASPAGGRVDVRVHAPVEDGDGFVVFEVRDSGPGIEPEARAKLFEPFYTKGKSNGTGLGLYVSHGIVQRHGGEIHAASPEGGGAVFTVKLPLHPFEATETLS
jgi:signal transduction histidine kinase